MNAHVYIFSLIGFIYSSLFTTNAESDDTLFRSSPSKTDGSPPEITVDGRRYIIYQGDVLMDPEEYELIKQNLTVYKNVATDTELLWPDNYIPYTIQPYVYNEHEIRIIHTGVQYLQAHTCLRFEFVAPTDPRYKIYVSKEGGGCFSVIGYQQRKNMRGGTIAPSQTVILADGCLYTGTVEHEFMHALGLDHEQARKDRDQYIDIYLDRVVPDYRYAFDKYAASTTYGLPYDYGSAMHYPRVSFPIDGQSYTMEAKDRRICLGNKHHATACDLLKVNLLYGCVRKNNQMCQPLIQYADSRTGFCDPN